MTTHETRTLKRSGSGRIALSTTTLFLGAVLAAKCADIATTLLGLALIPTAREAAPLAAAAIATVGPVLGLCALGAGSVALVVAWIELGAARTATPATARACNYGAVCALWLGASLHNTALIVRWAT